MQLLIAMTVTQ